MHSLPKCRFGWDAHAIAEMIGVSVMVEAGFGAAGSAYHLEDGRILKLTTSPQETTMAILGIQGQLEGLPLPMFYEVYKYEPEDLDETPCWAIVREEIEDLYKFPTQEEKGKAADWNKVAFEISAARSPEAIEKAVAKWDVHGSELREFLDGAKEVENALGIILGDWLAENVGRQGESGRVVIRDLSSVYMLNEIMEITDLERIPVLVNQRALSPR